MLGRMDESYVVMIFALCLWREARSQTTDEIIAVACSIRNRVKKQMRGKTYVEVITARAQYSSFPWINAAGKPVMDINGTRFPQPGGPGWDVFLACCGIADNVIKDITADTVDGATHYYDQSVDHNPPAWATVDPSSQHVKDIGSFRFWRVK